MIAYLMALHLSRLPLIVQIRQSSIKRERNFPFPHLKKLEEATAAAAAENRESFSYAS